MANQNQGMTIAVIIFVILTVISMAMAVVFVKEAGELKARLETAEKNSKLSSEQANETAVELNEIKKIITPEASPDTPTAITELKAKFETDLKKYGNRLKLIATEVAVPQTYSQMLDSTLSALEQRNAALEGEKLRVAAVTAQKADLEATFQAQADQYKQQADAANKEKADIQAKLTVSEDTLKKTQLSVTGALEQKNTEIQTLRADYTKQIDDLTQKLASVSAARDKLDKYVQDQKTTEFAATYDGEVTRVNPTSRTVWINLGGYDNLPKNLGFSVQAQGVPAGSQIPAKAKVEVIQILGDHLAECRIVEDDLKTPILVGDHVFTKLWEPGQRTRFAFAGKIDLDNNGSDDMDQVRALVDRAGGQIDAEIVNGELRGALNIDTRYLVLGAVPADKAGGDAYAKLIKEADDLGVQRVPMAVFFDQIGYKREARTMQFGGGTAAPRSLEAPDGGQRISGGRVTNAFSERRPPAATTGSAY